MVNIKLHRHEAEYIIDLLKEQGKPGNKMAAELCLDLMEFCGMIKTDEGRIEAEQRLFPSLFTLP
jgi:hypothetical protein